MAKAFSVASWNVKNLKGDKDRIKRVIAFLKDKDPDVFAIYELLGSDIVEELFLEFPNHNFQITEGPQSQEILVGVRDTFHSFITQRTEFKAGKTYLRPGQLLTLRHKDKYYNLLFLHLASDTAPHGFGLRDDMMDKAIRLKRHLDNAVGGSANYIFLGDLNTMGMEYPYYEDIDTDIELRKWDERARRYYDMIRLSKTHDETWYGGSDSSIPPGRLDHVYAAEHLKFTTFKDENNEEREIQVTGWVDKQTDVEKDDWADEYSDHALLYFEVEEVE